MELEAEEIKLRDEEARRVAADTSDEYQRMDEEDRVAKLKEKEAVLASLVSFHFLFSTRESSIDFPTFFISLSFQESSTASTSTIIQAARKSQLKRSTARETLDSAVPLTVERIAALRLLHSSNPPTTSPGSEYTSTEDIQRELERYDSYNALFEIRRKKEAYVGEKDLGDDTAGFVIEEVWEKAVRTGVMGLFLEPKKSDGEGEEVKDEMEL